MDRNDGVFISRIALETAVYNSGCLKVRISIERFVLVRLIYPRGKGYEFVARKRRRRGEGGAASFVFSSIETLIHGDGPNESRPNEFVERRARR